MSKYLDWFNIMTYDFHGSWNKQTGHNAPLYKNDNENTTDEPPSYLKSKYNCHAAIQGYINAGARSEQLVLGFPLYGRVWQGIATYIIIIFISIYSNYRSNKYRNEWILSTCLECM